MDASPLGVLTPELMFWVLDFLDPQEHSSFSATCRQALSLVKQCKKNNMPLAEFTRRRKIKLLMPWSCPLIPPLAILPTELIFQVLDYMYPHQYSGLWCTNRGALSLVNQKLSTPEGRGFDPLGVYISRTAGFVKHKRITWGPLPEDVG